MHLARERERGGRVRGPLKDDLPLGAHNSRNLLGVAQAVAGESMVTIAIAVFCVGGRQPRRQTRVLRSAEGRANAPCVCQLVTMLDQF